jgi:hypothetical protein
MALACSVTSQPGEAQVKLSFDGTRVNLAAENESYGNILDLLGRHTGLEFQIPAELKNMRVPLLEIQGLGVKATLLKIMEGSEFDFLLLGHARRPDSVARLIVSGKSKKIARPTGRSSPRSRPARKPFGRGNPAPYVTPFKPRPAVAPGVVPKQPPAQPTARPRTPLAPQQPNPFQTSRPYGQALGGPPQPNVQPRPGKPGQNQPTRRGGRRQIGNPNPYERR